jgi:hypothetical protein
MSAVEGSKVESESQSPTSAAIGPGGWLQLYIGKHPEMFPADILVRLDMDDRGALDVVEMRIAAKPDCRLDARLLRRISVDRVRQFANGPGRHALLDRIYTNAEAFGDVHLWMREIGREGEVIVVTDRDYGPQRDEAKVRIPPGRKRSDEFYREVAEVYERIAPFTRKPVDAIARRNQVAVGTVSGWIAEARRRGMLEKPTRPTKRKS